MPGLLQRLRSGDYIGEYKTDDGRTVRFRGPKTSDVDDLLRFINGLVEEEAMILVNKKQTRKNEAAYVKEIIKENKDGSALHLVAEVDGKAIAKAEVEQKKYKSSHVGTPGISVSKGYRDIGLGKAMVGLLCKLSKEYGLKLVTLGVFAENERAIHVYKKMGFKQVGLVPKELYHKKKYMDHVMMAKEL